MAKIDLGKINFVFRGTWAALTSYTERDVVVYTDSNITSTYVCITAVGSSTVGDNPSVVGVVDANWAYMAKGVTDALGAMPQGAKGGALVSDGDPNQTFTVGNTYPAWTDAAVATNALNGKAYFCDTSAAAWTMTLPANPTAGDTIWIVDAKGTFATNNLTLAGNGKNIHRQAADVTMNISDVSKMLIYHNATNGWIITG
ncbi:MAG: hypothetical protein QGH83_08720 [Candidatus Pacebacteria bacterium]|jgi:hypothetical protein|nr:hypothetical protein [Candidatus Paceibacterota bacterium]